MSMKQATLLYVLITLTFGMVFSSLAIAENFPCKPRVDPRSRWGSDEQIPLDYPVEFRLTYGPKFRVPYGYFLIRSTPERVNCYPERDQFDFAFWMPSLTPSKKEALNSNSWPVEEDRPPDGSYLVLVPYAQVIPDGADRPEFPFSGIEFTMKRYKERIPYPDQLTRITALDFWLEIYVNLDEMNGDTILDCGSSGCEFTFYFRDLKLALQGSFAKDKLSQWRAIKDSTRTLLERWMVK